MKRCHQKVKQWQNSYFVSGKPCPCPFCGKYKLGNETMFIRRFRIIHVVFRHTISSQDSLLFIEKPPFRTAVQVRNRILFRATSWSSFAGSVYLCRNCAVKENHILAKSRENVYNAKLEMISIRGVWIWISIWECIVIREWQIGVW